MESHTSHSRIHLRRGFRFYCLKGDRKQLMKTTTTIISSPSLFVTKAQVNESVTDANTRTRTKKKDTTQYAADATCYTKHMTLTDPISMTHHYRRKASVIRASSSTLSRASHNTGNQFQSKIISPRALGSYVHRGGMMQEWHRPFCFYCSCSHLRSTRHGREPELGCELR